MKLAYSTDMLGLDPTKYASKRRAADHSKAAGGVGGAEIDLQVRDPPPSDRVECPFSIASR